MQKLITIIIIFAFSSTCFSQQEIKTIKYTPHFTSSKETDIDGKLKKKQSEYWVDGKKTSKRKYNKANEQTKTISACHPCYLKEYYSSNKLKEQGLFWAECKLGKWIEYYENGKIKAIKNYQNNTNDIWVNPPCSIPDGEWTYYTKDGKVEKTEYYKEGIIIK